MTERLALTFVEIDIPVCSLTHGTSPCTATGTGDARCFNCLSTCQDLPNYDEEEVTLRFAKPTDDIDGAGIEAISALTSVDISPAMISLGEDLGQRASVTASFRDFKWSDTGPGFDPYQAGRTYNPFEQGTFWGKFRARQPYLRGRAMRVIRGFAGDTLAQMETRHYIVDSLDGLSTDGSFSITAKDVLKLLDGDRAQAPRLSNGFLSGSLSSSGTSITLSPSGIGDEEYPASGYGVIGGKEAVSFTRSGNTVTLTARGFFNTTAQAHSASDRFQVAIYYDALNAATIIKDLQTTYADVPDAQIDLAGWQQEVSSYNGRLYSGFIGEPTPVKDLVSELIEQVGLAIWPDDLNQLIRLQVLRPIATTAERFEDQNVLRGQMQIEEQPDRRLSRVWVYYGKINPLEGQEDPQNYRSSVEVVDLDAETNYGSSAIKTIFSRWIPAGGRSTALRVANILLNRFRDPPRRVSFPVFRLGPETPELGEGCIVNTRAIQDETGAREDLPVQIVRMGVTDTEYQIVADELRAAVDTDDQTIREITYDADINGVDLIEAHNDLYPPTTGGETVNVYIEEFATIGAASYGLPAFDVGSTSDWPTVTFSGTTTNVSGVVAVANTSAFKVGMAVSGPGFSGYRRVLSIVTNTSVTLDANASASATVSLTLYTVIINLYLRGRIAGPGGNGGTGAYDPGFGGRRSPVSGAPGGTALYVRYPINLFLDAGLGEAFGGGGGGGGAGVQQYAGHYGGGGGGGGGIPAGSGAGRNGSPGSKDAGGSAGTSLASYNWWQAPFETGVPGGNGGAPGSAGGGGSNHGGSGGDLDVGAAGAAGNAIDGVSWVKKTGTGDLRGPQVN